MTNPDGDGTAQQAETKTMHCSVPPLAQMIGCEMVRDGSDESGRDDASGENWADYAKLRPDSSDLVLPLRPGAPCQCGQTQIILHTPTGNSAAALPQVSYV